MYVACVAKKGLRATLALKTAALVAAQQSPPTVHLDDRSEYSMPYHVATENTDPISDCVLMSDVVRPEILGL